MIISRTPFRISFLGGGTDYPGWFMKHGGAVLAATIDKYCYLTVRHLPPFFEHRFRIVYSRIESTQRVEDIEHPAVREVLRHHGFTRGLEIHHDGDLPARSGMGSSSSFAVGLLHALYALRGRMPSKLQLAREAIHVEQELLKENVGCQDQVSAAYGGLNHISFLPNGDFNVRPMTLRPDRIADFNDHLLLFYTGVIRTASDVAASYVGDLEARRRQLRVMKDLVDEGIHVLAGDGPIAEFGGLLHEGWMAKRSLSAKISNPEVEEIYEAARGAGAIGGKLLGAGGGGFILLFAAPSEHEKIQERLSGLIHVPFRFESGGSQILYCDAEQDYASAEARRDRLKTTPFRELEPSALKDRS